MIGGGTTLSTDARGVESLRAAAARDPRAAIKEAAKQFEALFMHELMKSMRQATQSSSLSDDSTTQLGTEMLDTQFAQQMTGLRGGLSEAIARHLERQLGIAPGAAASDAAIDAHDADKLTRTINTTLRVQRALG